MIYLSVLELLYLVLTLFIVVIGTLLTLVLLRLLKILQVGTEIADMYFSLKEVLANITLFPEILRKKLMEIFWNPEDIEEVEQENKEQKKEPG